MVDTPPIEQSRPADARPSAATQLILASASPRRHELLALLGARFSIVATDAEDRDTGTPAPVLAALPALTPPLRQHPTLLAWRKAHAAATSAPEAVVLGADTVVVIDGDLLNKPRDAAHARAMLARLAGRSHTVYTGLCVLAPAPQATQQREVAPSLVLPPMHIWFDLVTSEVDIGVLSDAEIAAYVATGEPLDKAGAYGIQGLGGRLVRAVRGSYTAVVGLPLPATYRLLSAAGVAGLSEPGAAYKRWLDSQGKEPLPCPPTLP